MPTRLTMLALIACAALAVERGAAAIVQTPATATAIPPNTVSGSALHDGTRVTFSQGLAWWQAADHKVGIALFDHKPPVGILTKIRAGSWGNDGPIGLMNFELKSGAPVSIANVTRCSVNVDFPKAGPIGWSTDLEDRCGLIAISGNLNAGGTITARLKGQDRGGSDHKPFSWDVRFNLPIVK